MILACPRQNVLSNYLKGQIDEASAAEIDTHLSACTDCQETIATLESSPGDSLLQELAAPLPEDSFSQESECAAAVRQAQEALATSRLADKPTSATQLGVLRDYQLIEKLGEGGMGAVYKAMHTQLERVVALKVLPTDKTNDAATVQRFRREMKAVGRLNHENIVQATDAGEHEGTHFLVMEYVEGVDLSKLVKQIGPLPIAEACELIRQAAVGLQAAHEAGMIHRDIKPSNIMLTVNGTVKILDLGLARLSEAVDERELTQTGQVMGTIDYMSPEQCGSSHQVDARTDIYALGATLYKLLSGRNLFSGEQYSRPMHKMMALATEDPPPLSEHRAEVPKKLSDLVSRMLAKDPSERPSTPDEVARLLEPLASGADLSRLSTAPVEASKDTAVSNGTMPTDDRPSLPKPKGKTLRPAASGGGGRRPSWISLATGGAAAFLLIAFGIVFFLETPSGTLRVEVNDPSIEVAVKEFGVVLNDGQNTEEIKLQPGKKSLTVTRDDFTFETQSFLLKKNETIVVRVNSVEETINVAADGIIIGKASSRQPEQAESGNPNDRSHFPVDGTAAVRHAWLVNEINRLNPTYKGDVRPTESNGHIIQLALQNDGLTDIAPLAELKELRYLAIKPLRYFNEKGTEIHPFKGEGSLSDLSPLRGLPIEELEIEKCPISDLAPMHGMPLKKLSIARCQVIDLGPLEDAPLEELNCGHNPVRSIAPLAGAPLKKLICTGNTFTDLSPLADAPLEYLWADSTEFSDMTPLKDAPLKFLNLQYSKVNDISSLANCPLEHVLSPQKEFAEVLSSIPTLKQINHQRAEKWLLENLKIEEVLDKRNNATREASQHSGEGESKNAEKNYLPVRAFPAEGSMEEKQSWVVGELKRVNPDFNGLAAFIFQTDDDEIIGLRIDTRGRTNHTIRNISPLAFLKNLETLSCPKTGVEDLSPLTGLRLKRLDVGSKTLVSDLSPLAGMPLVHVDINHTRVKDLTPLQEAPLRYLDCEDLRLTDLSPLEGMPLEHLNLKFNGTLTDISPLNGMPLKYLEIGHVKATNLTPLADSPLETLGAGNVPFSDLTPLGGLPIRHLHISGSKVADFVPLRAMPLVTIDCDVDIEGARDVLREIKTLTKINGFPVESVIEASQ